MTPQWNRVLLGSVLVVALLGGCSSRGDLAPAAERSTSAPATTSVAATTAAPSPVFAASECTNAIATTRQVIERYLALSTSNNPQAVIDCFAKVWRDKHDTNPTFADYAAIWSKSGPVTNVTITFGDTVNGCDRFGVNAQLSNPSAGVYQAPLFLTVGPEAGRPRIFEGGTALVNPSLATTRCQ